MIHGMGWWQEPQVGVPLDVFGTRLRFPHDVHDMMMLFIRSHFDSMWCVCIGKTIKQAQNP